MPSTILTQQQQTVLELLRESVNEKRFYLAGGTALALQLGHRRSIDFDFFRESPFDTERLRSEFSRAQVLQEAKGTLTVLIEGVKVSFFEFRYLLMEPLVEGHPVPLASIDDIAAMKISAIAGRGSKKDFIDLYYAVQRARPLSEYLDLFERKFSTARTDKYHIMRSLMYFDDAEVEQMPEMIIALEWKTVKNFFVSEVKKLL